MTNNTEDLNEENEITFPNWTQTPEDAMRWLKEYGIDEMECIVPDQGGIARGKIMPTSKFFSSAGLRLPSSIFYQTIMGSYPEAEYVKWVDPADGDTLLVPDFRTLTTVPWASDPTAQIILDVTYQDGREFELAPRTILKKVLAAFAEKGLRPIVAPELEFYLVKPNTDPDYPLEPPIGRSGRQETGRRSYSIDAVNEFDEFFEDIYDYCDHQGLEIDTLIHEEGAAQMEINLRHGDPLHLADQVFLFKRTLREAAVRHDMYATFMAKPIANEPGSAMHFHQSIVDHEGQNIFSKKDGSYNEAFLHYIGGLQKYMPQIMPLVAPYVNSYRRFAGSYNGTPQNTSWGHDNRTTGFRVPLSDPASRRVENRLPSSDANVYVAMAASLAAGYLGMKEKLEPLAEQKGAAAEGIDKTLPRDINTAIDRLRNCDPIKELLGETFIDVYCGIKYEEYLAFMDVISPWEREHLLLNV